ncbi:hypothetical protein Ancab_037759 [Ancistrocladus abbreviatus]
MDFLISNWVPIVLTLLASILAFLSLQIFTSKYVNAGKGKKKYPPIAGTVFNQLLNFDRLHDYMTDLAAKYTTYRLISPYRNEIYTSDPANVEYILKTNFNNYGKLPTLMTKRKGQLKVGFASNELEMNKKLEIWTQSFSSSIWKQ